MAERTCVYCAVRFPTRYAANTCSPEHRRAMANWNARQRAWDKKHGIVVPLRVQR